ncbi:MAG: LytR family transcriptional regulator [Ruminococcaceae bacterium]|nr:LytR family transcriptional regulator [Oscillospiraceae bacterium]
MRNLVKIIALLLVIAMAFTFVSCAKMNEFFGSDKPITDKSPSGSVGTIEDIDPRSPGLYNFLLIREGAKAGDMITMSVAQMSMRDGTLSILHIPENLFVNDGDTKSLGAIYEKEYSRVYALGMSVQECELSGARVVGDCLERDLAIPIDYHAVINEYALKSYVDLIGGVEINLPFEFTTNAGNTYKAGARTLDGDATFDFLNYDMFEDTASKFGAVSEVLAGIHKKIRATLSSNNISIHMVQAKPFFSTDVPTKDGYDIFFLRKLVAIEPTSWKVSVLCTYPVSVSYGDFEVVRYATALEQINTFFNSYVDPIKSASEQTVETDKIFDGESRMTDESQAILNNIYKSQTSLPIVNTAEDVYLGKLVISQK